MPNFLTAFVVVVFCTATSIGNAQTIFTYPPTCNIVRNGTFDVGGFWNGFAAATGDMQVTIADGVAQFRSASGQAIDGGYQVIDLEGGAQYLLTVEYTLLTDQPALHNILYSIGRAGAAVPGGDDYVVLEMATDDASKWPDGAASKPWPGDVPAGRYKLSKTFVVPAGLGGPCYLLGLMICAPTGSGVSAAADVDNLTLCKVGCCAEAPVPPGGGGDGGEGEGEPNELVGVNFALTQTWVNESTVPGTNETSEAELEITVSQTIADDIDVYYKVYTSAPETTATRSVRIVDPINRRTHLVRRDYLLTSGKATIPGGNNVVTLNMDIFDDALEEGFEWITVDLTGTSPNAHLGTQTRHVVYIRDDEFVMELPRPIELPRP